MNLIELNDIHKSVKSRFLYRSDIKTYGTEEFWNAPESLVNMVSGDCEDFALLCRAECRKRNIPSRLVFCLVGNVAHVVLSVCGQILDNRHSEVIYFKELQYKWLAISGYNPGDDWRMILE